MAGLDLEQIIDEDHKALEAFLRGDPEPKKRLYSRKDDVTLANPLGPPARGWTEVAEALDRAASLLRDGEVVSCERISGYATADLAGPMGEPLRRRSRAPRARVAEARRHRPERPLRAGAARVLLDHVRDLSDRLAETEVAGLIHRERRILALIAEGYTNRAIGEVLHLSPKAIANQASGLFEKLGVRRRSQAAAWAGQRRLRLSPDGRV